MRSWKNNAGESVVGAVIAQELPAPHSSEPNCRQRWARSAWNPYQGRSPDDAAKDARLAPESQWVKHGIIAKMARTSLLFR